MIKRRSFFGKNLTYRYPKRRRVPSGAHENVTPSSTSDQIVDSAGSTDPAESTASVHEASQLVGEPLLGALPGAKLGRTAEFRLAPAPDPVEGFEGFQIQVRRVQGHWISKARTQSAGQVAPKLYAGLGDTLAKSLLELAKHLEADVSLEELMPGSGLASRPRSH